LNLTDTTSDSTVSAYQVIATAAAMKSSKVYGGTSTDETCLCTPAEGTPVDVYGVSGSWAAVSVQGVLGFMQTADLANYQPANAKVTQLSAPIYATVSASSGAVLRELPADLSTQRAQLPEGTPVAVYAYTDDWANVLTRSGAAGFVARSALSVEPVQPAPTSAPENGITTVDGTKYVYVASASAVMYETYSESSSALATLPYGTQVQIGAYNSDWACVKYGSTYGYIRMPKLTERSPVSQSADDVITAEFFAETTSTVSVYAQPSSASEVIGQMGSGQRVSVYAYNNAYAYIGVGQNRGYVEISKLRIVV